MTMRRLMTRPVALGVLVALFVVDAPLSARAAEPTVVPSSPSSVAAYEGVDGVLMQWAEPFDSSVTNWVVQRAATPDGEFTDIGTVPREAPRQHLDPAAANETWNYRVLAVNSVGRSNPSWVKTATVPAPVDPGVIDGFAITGTLAGVSPGDVTAGGAYFTGAGLTIGPWSSPGGFVVRGVSDATSIQGARTAGLTIKTVLPNGRRMTPGTYGFGDVSPGAVSVCPYGTLTVHEASFKADGTPLVFSATRAASSMCGWSAVDIRWRAHTGIDQALISSNPKGDFGDVPLGQTAERTISFSNEGTVAQSFGSARLGGQVDGAETDPNGFDVVADTCSGATVAPAATCSITITSTPKALDRVFGRLSLPDSTRANGRELQLETWGIDRSATPVLTVSPNFHLIQLYWPAVTGGQHAPAETYTVLRGTSPDTMTPLVELPATADRFIDHDVAVGTTYHYALIATNKIGTSHRSAVVPGAPSPTGILVSANGHYSGSEHYPEIAWLSPAGAQSRVTDGPRTHDTPAVSPDGSTIAWTSNDDNTSDFDLWIQRGRSAPVKLSADASTDDVEPAFSPDGSMIAFTRATRSWPPMMTTWIVPAAGGTPKQLVLAGSNGSPAWSPNGRLIAVAHRNSTLTPPMGSIRVATPDGVVHREVPGTAWDASKADTLNPSWSPDGSKISFIRQTDSTGSLFVIPALGGTASKIWGAGNAVLSQQWAPAGDRIVFAGLFDNKPQTLWSIPPAGGTANPLAGNLLTTVVSPAVAEPAAPYVSGPKPTAVGGLRADLAALYPSASWNASPDAAWYVVRRSAAGGPAPTGPEDGVPVYTGTATSTELSGLTTGSDYQLAVFAFSARGDVGVPAVLTLALAAAPVITPNATVPPLFGSGTAFTATWGPHLRGGRVYEVHFGTRSYNPKTGTWSSLTYAPHYLGASGDGIVNLKRRTATYLRARVRDPEGRSTPWGTAVVAATFDDRVLAPSDGWHGLQGQSGRFAATLLRSTAPKDSLSLTAAGSHYALIVDRCPTCGRLKVYVDGKLHKTVDTGAARTVKRSQVWSASFSSSRKHTIKVVTVGTKGRPRTVVDAVLVRP